jgi:hypothetical protein
MLNTAALLYGSFTAGYAVGTALWDAVGDSRVYPTASGWQYDEGIAPITSNGEQYCVNNVGCWHASKTAACAAWFASPSGLSGQGSYQLVTVDNGFGPVQMCRLYYPSGQYAIQAGVSVRTGSSTTCPASIDALNPAFSVPAGGAPTSDGKCRTGRYTGVAPDVAAGIIGQHGKDPATDPTLGPRLAEDILNKGGTIPGAQPGTMTGPASATGSPTTTTTNNPDGTTKVETKTPSYAYTYAPQTINYSTTITTVTNNAGDVTTTTTTEGEKPQSACEKNPDSIGCSKFGTPPTDAPKWKEVPVTYSPIDLGLPSGCPASRHMPWRGIDLVVNYAPACDVAPIIRAALLAMVALSCAGFIVSRLTNS